MNIPLSGIHSNSWLTLKKLIVWFCFLPFISVCGQHNDERLLTDTSNFKIEYIPLGSTSTNYHAVPFHDGIVYATSKGANLGVVYSGSKGEAFTDLYFTKLNQSGKWKKPSKFSKTINSKYSEGPFCFNQQGNHIYFTSNRSNVAEQVVKGKKNTLKIYKAELINNSWTNFEPFVWNGDSYSVGHPTISKDEKKIFFVSDMPGGYGGSDLYVSYLHQGLWSKPINMGGNINTRKDELFPFIHEDGTLYFSSDGHNGLGKLDIYSAEFEDSEWKNVVNLESPMNSSADDYSFVLEQNGSSGYFSSNRVRHDKDEVYRFYSFKSKCDKMEVANNCFTFFDKNNSDPINIPMIYEWDFGDGTRKRGLEADHCYENSGEYKVALNLIDTLTGNSFFNEQSFTVSIEDLRSPYFNTLHPLIPNSVIGFNGSRSRINNALITELIWDFGDGVKSIGKNVSHVYHHAGSYEVSLLVKGIDSLRTEVERCVYKQIVIKDTLIPSESKSKPNRLAENPHRSDSLTYEVQVKSSAHQIPINNKNFAGLSNVKEYESNGKHIYTVGQGKTLEEMYPLYSNVKIKGYHDAIVVAIKNHKIISHPPSAKIHATATYTHLKGTILSDSQKVSNTTLTVEDLTTGEILSSEKIIDGEFSLMLQNGKLYGFYGKKENYFSLSNFLDLREEQRNLEVSKNIEMLVMEVLKHNSNALRINNLFFKTMDAEIASESYPELIRLSEIIKNFNLKAEISGHTDNTGEEEYNLLLSQKRADAVKEYLYRLGCPSGHLLSKGYGYSKPMEGNDTEKGRYLNRRVEIKFIQ